jgi:hypothetical protein
MRAILNSAFIRLDFQFKAQLSEKNLLTVICLTMVFQCMLENDGNEMYSDFKIAQTGAANF